MSRSPSPSSAAAAESRRMLPTAPYPPMSHRNPSTQLKSSLSSKPQYSSNSLPGTTVATSVDGSMADLSESDSKSRSSFACVAKFCHPSLIAAINPSSSVVASSGTTTTTTTPDLVNGRSASRKLGPVLLEIQRLQWNPTGNSLYSLETVARSRGNPSLGTSIASTCLDVWTSLDDSSGGATAPLTNSVDGYTIQPLASGLSTGALCVHTFPSDFDWWNAHDDGTTTASNATTTTEYYHTGRHHRPATAVAWRPGTSHQVAITWASGSSSSSGGGGSSGTHPSKRGVAVGSQRVHPHDRDFGCFLWDLQSHSTKVPLRRLGHQVGATDVAWIMQGNLMVRLNIVQSCSGQGRILQIALATFHSSFFSCSSPLIDPW